MDSLLVYGSDSDSDGDPALSTTSGADAIRFSEQVGGHGRGPGPIQQPSILPHFPASASPTILPPPPEDLLASAAPGSKAWNDLHGGRVRSFPHVEGNYALHIYIPVTLPSYARNAVIPLIDKAIKWFPGLQLLEEGLTHSSSSDRQGPEVCAGSAGRVKLSGEYHISLSRTVAIRVHQIESITSMLRHKFTAQKRYFVEFSSWEVFTNDERTRTFLSLEIIRAGLSEIHKQVFLVDEVFRLHNLPTFYENPRPHISLAWALGDVTSSVKPVADELNRVNAIPKNVGERGALLWSAQVRRVECKIGQRVYPVWVSHP